jgi:hypothetical protein
MTGIKRTSVHSDGEISRYNKFIVRVFFWIGKVTYQLGRAFQAKVDSYSWYECS